MDSIKISSVKEMRFGKRVDPAKATSSNSGSLHLTPHHLIFRSDTASEVWVPLPLLYSVSRTPPSLDGSLSPLVLRTRNFEVYELTFASSDEADGVWDSLKGLCTGVAATGMEGLYAFFYEGEGVASGARERKGKGRAGWDVYDPVKEFARMGVGSRSKAWRFSKINADYEFCPSYPSEIVVPSKISDSTLNYAVKYRSKGRIPGLVYLHHTNLGSITRSSQPMVGLKMNRSIQDEKLIESIFTSHSQHSTAVHRANFTLVPAGTTSSTSLDSQGGQVVYGAQATNLIIDARPTTNAMANSVKGAGTENMDHYRNCEKAYLGIDNIHVMRASLNGVFDALRESETTGHLDRSALRRTNWLKHLTNILDGILVITRTIHLSNSHVLVHCSDGWDRTSQLSSIAQLCLDPYYRTGEGFAVLIEKDWLSYGHRFADRNGHLCADRVDFVTEAGDAVSAQSAFLASVQKQFSGSSHAFKETCPVFHQFLDCVYQIMRQFPTRFEFNERLLRKLQWETYAGRSGSFLFNSAKERESLHARDRTRSVWEEVFDDVDGDLSLKEDFKNAQYERTLDDPQSRALDADQGVLLVDPQNVRWWFEVFERGDEEMNGRPEVHPTPPNDDSGDSVTYVHDSQDDPIVAPLVNATENLRLPTSSTGLPGRTSSPRSSSPLDPAHRTAGSGLSGVALPSQDQLAGALSTAQKFGWGAWKQVQKGYQEAVKQYGEANPGSSGSPGSSSPPRTTQAARQARTNGDSSGSGWRTESMGAAELSPPTVKAARTAKSNPWSEAPSSAASSASSLRQSASSHHTSPLPPAPTTSFAPLPPPPVDHADPLDPLGARKLAPDPSSTYHTAVANDNPWDRRTTPAPVQPPVPVKVRTSIGEPLTPPAAATPDVAEVGVQNGKTDDLDPLGVGFS